MKVLVVGSGGREHALAWKIAQSPRVHKVYAAPGNAGTETIAQNVPIGAEEVDALLAWAVAEKIDRTVVGPEAPLVAGLADRISDELHIDVFGPRAAGARLEGSKVFAKEFMQRYHIPTADFAVFDDAEVRHQGGERVVGDFRPRGRIRGEDG